MVKVSAQLLTSIFIELHSQVTWATGVVLSEGEQGEEVEKEGEDEEEDMGESVSRTLSLPWPLVQLGL